MKKSIKEQLEEICEHGQVWTYSQAKILRLIRKACRESMLYARQNCQWTGPQAPFLNDDAMKKGLEQIISGPKKAKGKR